MICIRMAIPAPTYSDTNRRAPIFDWLGSQARDNMYSHGNPGTNLGEYSNQILIYKILIDRPLIFVIIMYQPRNLD